MTTTKDILKALANGKLSIEEAERELQKMAVSEIGGVAAIDLGREERAGIPEVVFAEAKGKDELVKIVSEMVDSRGVALITRSDKQKVEAIEKGLENVELHVAGRDEHFTVLVHSTDWKPVNSGGKIAIMTAGTSDIPYAREAEAIANVMGVDVLSFFDVGVAGIHRLVEPVKKIIDEGVDAVVVFAGMEGALPTVIASLIDVPVIGVPVPTGYGHGGKGETALAAMLQSCAPGLAVVNIGNGLGAGAFASLIAKKASAKRE
ncbi:MAG: nickel pincer cofactor biosynthesis protein LarB [Candidatus Thorarchaeota archaeon]|nr:MAG: nickel pincer cofactor biosynthesis protein LarB [Candidatus Thorarchaeota archaeon]